MNLWRITFNSGKVDYLLGDKFYKTFLKTYRISDLLLMKRKRYIKHFKQ